jgi:hypothetical protein
MPFSVRTMLWSGEHRAFVVEEFIQNGDSPIMTQRAFGILFALINKTFTFVPLHSPKVTVS